MVVNIGGIVLANHLDEGSFEFVEAEKKIKVKPVASNHAKFTDALQTIPNEFVKELFFREIETADGGTQSVVTGVLVTQGILKDGERDHLVYIGDRPGNGEMVDPSDWMVKNFEDGEFKETIRPFAFKGLLGKGNFKYISESLDRGIIGVSFDSVGNSYPVNYKLRALDVEWNILVQNSNIISTSNAAKFNGLLTTQEYNGPVTPNQIVHFSINSSKYENLKLYNKLQFVDDYGNIIVDNYSADHITSDIRTQIENGVIWFGSLTEEIINGGLVIVEFKGERIEFELDQNNIINKTSTSGVGFHSVEFFSTIRVALYDHQDLQEGEYTVRVEPKVAPILT